MSLYCKCYYRFQVISDNNCDDNNNDNNYDDDNAVLTPGSFCSSPRHVILATLHAVTYKFANFTCRCKFFNKISYGENFTQYFIETFAKHFTKFVYISRCLSMYLVCEYVQA